MIQKIVHDSVFYSVFQKSHDAVIISDESSLVVFWNDAAETMFEYSQREAVGCDFHDLICPESLRDKAKDSIKKFINSTGCSTVGMVGKTVTVPAKRKNSNEEFYVELSISSMIDEDGKLWIYAFLRDATVRVRNEKNLKYRAETDELTKIANRRKFQQVIESLSGRSVILFIFDLDHFKKINDQYGHDVGDQVICNFCENFLKQLPTAVLVARNGGEEFSAIYNSGDLETVLSEVRAVRQSYLQRLSIVSSIPSCTFSAGVVHSTKMTSERDLLKSADLALYVAKERGRNRIEVFSES